MELNINCFVNNSNYKYGLALLITAPLYGIIEVSYNKDNNIYKETYFINQNDAGSLWTRTSYINYTLTKSRITVYADLTNAYNNEPHIFLYFGKDATGKTNNNYFHLLYKSNEIIRGYCYNIKFIIKEGNLSDVIDLTTKGSSYWDMNAGSNRELVVNEEGILQVSDLNVINNIPNVLRTFRIGDYQTLILKKGSYSNKYILLRVQSVAYELNNGYIAILNTSNNKEVVYYSNINSTDFDVYEDDDFYYIKCNSWLVITLMNKDVYEKIVNTSSITLPTQIENKINLHDSIDSFNFSNPLAAGLPDFIKGNNGRIYWFTNGSLVDAFGLSNIVRNFGSQTLRPTGVFVGFQYFDTTLNKPIYWNGTKWVDSEGNDADSPMSGSFADRPTEVKVGYSYFCTDKQTTEGTTNGIMIYYKGSNTWVDALGRVVS